MLCITPGGLALGTGCSGKGSAGGCLAACCLPPRPTGRMCALLADEKVAIARRYLEPQAAHDAGVPSGSVRLADDALEALISEYCREAGVRNLKKHIEKVGSDTDGLEGQDGLDCGTP